MGKLLALFIVVPAVELYLLIKLGGFIGVLATVGIIVVTGALGAFLARSQGLGVLRDVQQELARGGLPTSSLADGVMILIAAALLVTPGFLTDVVGFLCLVPGFRSIVKKLAISRLKRAIQDGRTGVFVQFGNTGPWPPNNQESVKDERNIEM